MTSDDDQGHSGPSPAAWRRFGELAYAAMVRLAERDAAEGRQPEFAVSTIEELGTPICGQCLTMLELAGTDDRPYWWCPSCKVARLT